MTHLSSSRAIGMLAVAAFLCSVTTAVTFAQAPPPRRGPAIDMQLVADSLGVQCEYCHDKGQVTSTGKPRLEVAREMIVMTRELNERVPLVTGKTASEAVRVDCSTCHHGVPVPRPLRDLVLESVMRQGPDEAAKLYRDLRTKYFGGQSYDFSEQTLIAVTDRLAQSRPDAAIAIADLNLEFYPRSWRSYLAKGIAQSRRLDSTPAAVDSFRKALEIDPDNGIVQGWLAQTEPVARRVR